MQNWNLVNNELSEAVLASDRLEELLAGLGTEVRSFPGAYRLRGRCPVHGGKDANFAVGTHGHDLPIYWACFSHKCHASGKLKGNLLGLVRGALTKDPNRPATMARAKAFIEEFLARGPTRVSARPTCVAPPAPKTLSLTREQVRGVLRIPSPSFVGRGFDPVVLDRFDIGESSRLRRAVVPIYDDGGGDLCGLHLPVGPSVLRRV